MELLQHFTKPERTLRPTKIYGMEGQNKQSKNRNNIFKKLTVEISNLMRGSGAGAGVILTRTTLLAVHLTEAPPRKV
jgi:hypothetical protein